MDGQTDHLHKEKNKISPGDLGIDMMAKMAFPLPWSSSSYSYNSLLLAYISRLAMQTTRSTLTSIIATISSLKNKKWGDVWSMKFFCADRHALGKPEMLNTQGCPFKGRNARAVFCSEDRS